MIHQKQQYNMMLSSPVCVTARAHHASSLPAAAADGLDGDGGAGGLDGDGGADGLDGDEDEVAVL